MEMWWTVGLCFSWVFYFANGQEFILPGDVIPSHYDLKLLYDIDPVTNHSFYGVVDITLKAAKSTTKIVLHAKDLFIVEDKVRLNTVGSHTVMRNDGIPQIRVAVDKHDFLTLDNSQELMISEVYSLSIPFYGNLNEDLTGAYINAYLDKQSMAKEYSIITLFEPMHARKAFPCFDEPKYKATFKLTIGHHRDYHAISNMPLDFSTDVNDNPSGYQASWPWNVTKYKNNFIWDHFAKSLKMSTYFVSYVVSKFVHVESPNNLSKTKTRIWARRDVINQASYAASVAPKILSYFENLFNISYILPKMDHVAAHNFLFGGFEGWGLITYKEVFLLYDDKQSTTLNKIMINQFMCHEVSHQWFGNLVTLKWWTELWLKEGFANFMADLAMTALWPEINTFNIIEEVTKVFKTDALQSSRPVKAPIEATSPNLVMELYDEISYSKGAILLRMLYLTLGEKVFKEAIHNYLEKNSYQSTVQDDLWEQLTEVSHKYQLLPSDVTVAQVMAAWIGQAGYPLVTVTRDYNTKSLAIHQVRYTTTNGLHGKNEYSESWWVPLSVMAQRDQNSKSPIKWLADNEGTDVLHRYQHAAEEDEWLLFNVDMTALCRFNYDLRNWHLVIKTLKSGDYTTIPILSRVQLLMDAFELAWTNKLDYGTTLELASYLHREEDHGPLKTALQSLDLIKQLLKRSSDYGIFQKYVRRLIQKTYLKFKGLAKKTDQKTNDYNNVMMQITTSEWACKMDVPACEDNAVELFQQWMNTKDPDKNNPIPVELRETVYCVGVARGSARHWHFILERAQSASQETATAAVMALGCTREAWLLQRSLEITVSDSPDNGLRKSFQMSILLSVIESPVGFYMAKEFIYKEIGKLFERFKQLSLGFLREMVQQFTTQHELDEAAYPPKMVENDERCAREKPNRITSFSQCFIRNTSHIVGGSAAKGFKFLNWYDTHAKLLEASTSTIAQGIEKAKSNIAWLNKNRETVIVKLKQFSEDSQGKMYLKQSSEATKIVPTNLLICFIYFFI